MPLPRRSFLTLPALLLPWQPERVYSFLPAWRLVNRRVFDSGWMLPAQPLLTDSALDPMCGQVRWPPYGSGLPATIHPDNLLDVLKSADAYGYARPVVL